MNCTFNKWGGGYWYGPSWCVKQDCRVKSGYHRQYCDGLNYDNCPIYRENMDKNCFFITILCEKLGQPRQDNLILNNLRTFRKNVLDKNEKYKDLLVYHDRISPIISDAIRNTKIESIDEFIDVIYSNYILPIDSFITNQEVSKAIDRYRKMLELLIVNFSLGQQYAEMRHRYKHPEHYNLKTRIKSFIH